MLTLKNDRAPVLEPQRSLPCAGEYDVLVVGGGIAGYAAGVAAAASAISAGPVAALSA